MRSPSRSKWQTIYACKTRKITKIAISIWSVNLREYSPFQRSLGAKTVCGLGVQTVRSPEYITRMDARSLTAAARCILRGTPHTHTRAEPDTTERDSKEHCHAVTH
ncbi:hypothetical protein EVAR_95614_1 [Eumeta japonica]|uniref:Uncharacterized protein n=1 Tax=Eumeta variegata TaxID=151549 RepID=A0A4C1VM87_EUMVA|nr:hypothetical protein EVAR_95614_1 [Eumeta japonica]